MAAITPRRRRTGRVADDERRRNAVPVVFAHNATAEEGVNSMRCRARLLAGITAALLVFAGCGGDDDNADDGAADTADGATSTTVRTELTDADLEELLVPIEEVPSGYTVDTSEDDSDEPTRLCGKSAISETIPHDAQAEVTYLGGQIGPGLFEQLTSYPSRREAAQALDAARDALRSCTEFDDTDDDGTVTHYTIANLSFDQVAEDQLAVRLELEAEEFTGSFDLVASRAGNIIILTGGLSLVSAVGSAKMEPGDFVDFTKSAVSRVEDAV
jgi:hypothetical protein